MSDSHYAIVQGESSLQEDSRAICENEVLRVVIDFKHTTLSTAIYFEKVEKNLDQLKLIVGGKPIWSGRPDVCQAIQIDVGQIQQGVFIESEDFTINCAFGRVNPAWRALPACQPSELQLSNETKSGGDKEKNPFVITLYFI